jgi:UDP-N-acetylglucosamine acyltransferase
MDGWYSSTHTFGGRVDQTAVIGHAPEHRDWRPGQPAIRPVLGDGVRVEAFVTIDAGMERATTIGARTWLMKACHLGHDVVVGEDCEFAPHCSIGGHVTIGDRVRFGMGVLVKPYVTIGDGARLGMGAVVLRDVPPGEVWIGNPARPLDRHAEDKLRAIS